jgi:hypothetical protein
MFVRGLAKVGEYQPRSWKVENWWKPSAPAATLIPGVSNTTVAEVAGGGLLAVAVAWAAAKYFKIL